MDEIPGAPDFPEQLPVSTKFEKKS